ncbi:glycosyltransferase family 2 protein [Scleroderma citrinum Foug A]|uniref:Glycosyltransferase family 2 protein n=1 Tax=Scleroderma citrinum Foug A TaxID=1036808 RepID=A0A0C3DTE9_9AGAM|nr:glycosyltransferase family 2 protein [Scleroderma citrinum Foug A]
MMVIMHFLNKVHYTVLMNPLELEMYPDFYVSHHEKVLDVCGETLLANAKQSIIMMMQVYEYFITHHMAKVFEGLLGSMTCLPGCFTLFCLCTPDTHKLLLISNQIVLDYSQNCVDTLHMKNLLHLSEDRYFTMLLLKQFPMYKTQFILDAHVETATPMTGIFFSHNVVGGSI